MNKRIFLKCLLIAFATIAPSLTCLVSAQTFPNKPIRIVIGFPAGGPLDLHARLLADKLQTVLGQAVLIDYKAGAGGTVGAQDVMKSAPDGHTLLMGANTMLMASQMYKNVGFDPVKDFAPVSMAAYGSLMLVANPKTGIKSLADLIKEAQAKPGAISFGSPGVGTPHHLSMELFKNTAQVFLTHIPYRGTGPAVTDLLGGQVDTMFLPIHVALPHIRSGRLIALGIGSDKRHALLPDLPTLLEAKAGNVNVDMWYGIFAPKGTPADIVTKLNAEINKIVNTAEVKAIWAKQGAAPMSMSAPVFAKYVIEDVAKWATIVKVSGAKAD